MGPRDLYGTLLVPTDFSDESFEVFKWACHAVSGDDAVVIVLHVLEDRDLDMISDHGFAERATIEKQIRERADAQMSRFQESPCAGVEVDSIVSVGTPFLDIIRKSQEFAVDAIVMNKHGTREFSEQLLFGSTAEKVLRGSRCPVIVVPIDFKLANG